MPRPQMRPVRFNRLILNLRSLEGRELVIVGASLLELALEVALSKRMTAINADEHAGLFSDRGPLSSLSAKIAAAQALGIVTRRSRRELDNVRRLRNVVAHSWEVLNLDEQPCRDFVDKFSYLSLKQVDLATEGAVIRELDPMPGGFEMFGESFLFEDIDVIMDPGGFIGFFVPRPPSRDLTSTEKVRHQIWFCTMSIVSPVLGEWLSEPGAAEDGASADA